MTTLNETYSATKNALQAANIENASLEARRLISHAASLEDDAFITRGESVLATKSQSLIDTMLKRRLLGEPLSKIIGTQEFWGLPFNVTQDTLDPRADTETLIQAVLDYCQTQNLKDAPIKILDLGTGTGCIAITLLTELKNATATAVDISDEALSITNQNAVLNNVSKRLTTLQSDWCAGVSLAEYDIIVSNPPYIRDEVILDLQSEVKNHDPILALSGGENGMDAYKKILFSLNTEKKLKARIFFEIGFDQRDDLSRLVDESNLIVRAHYNDLGGNPRVVEIACGDN